MRFVGPRSAGAVVAVKVRACRGEDGKPGDESETDNGRASYRSLLRVKMRQACIVTGGRP